MIRLNAQEAQASFTNTLDRVAHGERVVVQQRGKDLMALIPMEDLELLCELEGRVDAEAGQEALTREAETTLERLGERPPLTELPVLAGHRLLTDLPSRAEIYDEIYSDDEP